MLATVWATRKEAEIGIGIGSLSLENDQKTHAKSRGGSTVPGLQACVTVVSRVPLTTTKTKGKQVCVGGKRVSKNGHVRGKSNLGLLYHQLHR